MTTAAQVLNAKPDHALYTTTPDASVFEAISEMARRNVGALLVMEGGEVIGIVSERDYARKIVLLARASRDTEVQDIMTSPVMYVQPTQTVEECMALMTEKRLRHLPVMDKGELRGLISIGDLVKQVITDQKHVIEQLEHYISGQPA